MREANLIGSQVKVRADRQLVKAFLAGSITKATGLGVLDEGPVKKGLERVGLVDDRREVVKDHEREAPPKNDHAASQPSITAALV